MRHTRIQLICVSYHPRQPNGQDLISNAVILQIRILLDRDSLLQPIGNAVPSGENKDTRSAGVSDERPCSEESAARLRGVTRDFDFKRAISSLILPKHIHNVHHQSIH